MTADIYNQHRAAFANVSAYVILKDGEKVATIAFKFPKDGAGRLYAYVHWFGLEMVRGMAGGYGYDKQSAACANASKKAIKDFKPEMDRGENIFARAAFFRLLAEDSGMTWSGQLERAGFTVLSAL